MSVRSIILACLLAISASTAAWPAENFEQEARAACTHDALVHCTLPALRGDRTGVRDCLVKRVDKISARCRALVEGGTADNDGTTDAGNRTEVDAQSSPENAVSPR